MLSTTDYQPPPVDEYLLHEQAFDQFLPGLLQRLNFREPLEDDRMEIRMPAPMPEMPRANEQVGHVTTDLSYLLGG